METQLTTKDIEHLMDAVSAWESAPSRDALNKSTFKMMIGAISSADKDEISNDIDEEMDSAKLQTSLRKETAIMLQAKLIQMKMVLLQIRDTQSPHPPRDV